MAKQKPPKPAGKISGFPYSIVWEEFGEISDRLEPKIGTLGRYEALITWRAGQGEAARSFPTRDDIFRIVSALEVSAPVSEGLIETLYGIAAAYCLPRLKAELGWGALATAEQLNRISRLASQLVQLLAGTDPEIEFIMELVRCAVIDPGAKPKHNGLDLIDELISLAARSELCASEIPRLRQGSSINVMQIRLMEAAAKAIGDSTSIELEVKQTDGVGRHPRPGSASAKVLFKYLNLVDPAMTDTTKVRLFLAFKESLNSDTPGQIPRNEFP